jgi:hypothetical protein
MSLEKGRHGSFFIGARGGRQSQTARSDLAQRMNRMPHRGSL